MKSNILTIFRSPDNHFSGFVTVIVVIILGKWLELARRKKLNEKPYKVQRFRSSSVVGLFLSFSSFHEVPFFRLHDAGVPCPEPILLRSHVLMINFLGVNRW